MTKYIFDEIAIGIDKIFHDSFEYSRIDSNVYGGSVLKAFERLTEICSERFGEALTNCEEYQTAKAAEKEQTARYEAAKQAFANHLISREALYNEYSAGIEAYGKVSTMEADISEEIYKQVNEQYSETIKTNDKVRAGFDALYKKIGELDCLIHGAIDEITYSGTQMLISRYVNRLNAQYARVIGAIYPGLRYADCKPIPPELLLHNQRGLYFSGHAAPPATTRAVTQDCDEFAKRRRISYSYSFYIFLAKHILDIIFTIESIESTTALIDHVNALAVQPELQFPPKPTIAQVSLYYYYLIESKVEKPFTFDDRGVRVNEIEKKLKKDWGLDGHKINLQVTAYKVDEKKRIGDSESRKKGNRIEIGNLNAAIELLKKRTDGEAALLLANSDLQKAHQCNLAI